MGPSKYAARFLSDAHDDEGHNTYLSRRSWHVPPKIYVTYIPDMYIIYIKTEAGALPGEETALKGGR